MEISQVGPSQVPQSKNENSGQRAEKSSRKVERHDVPSSADVAKRERVEFTKNAQKMQAMQADVSRIQNAEAVIEKLEKTISNIVGVFSDRIDAQREENTQVNSELANLNELAQSADRNNLNGTPMEFVINGKEVSLETLDISRDVKEITADIIASMQNGTQAEFKTDLPGKLDIFRGEAAAIRTAIENEVRNTIAGSMKESAATLPKDIYSAEKLLTSLRAENSTSNPAKPDSGNSIDGKTINILK